MKKPNLLKLVFYFTIAVLTLCMATGCGAHKRTFKSNTELNAKVDVVKKTNTVETENTATEMETTRYGDTLRGNFPLPKLTAKPIVLTAQSAGQSLKISITKTGLKYTSIPKPISTTKIKQDQQKQTASKVDETKQTIVKEKEAVASTDERKQWKPPTWLIIIFLVIAILLVSYFLTPLKTLLKRFKN